MSGKYSDILVIVTDEDIRAAEDTRSVDREMFYAPASCPVAKALRRITGGIWNVGTYYASDRQADRSYVLPKELTNWIARWDNRQYVAPISSILTPAAE